MKTLAALPPARSATNDFIGDDSMASTAPDGGVKFVRPGFLASFGLCQGAGLLMLLFAGFSLAAAFIVGSDNFEYFMVAVLGVGMFGALGFTLMLVGAFEDAKVSAFKRAFSLVDDVEALFGVTFVGVEELKQSGLGSKYSLERAVTRVLDGEDGWVLFRLNDTTITSEEAVPSAGFIRLVDDSLVLFQASQEDRKHFELVTT